jgi:hypothetical protein
LGTLTKKQRDQLRELASKSTQVVGWYDHGLQDGTIRGPFHRWFKCEEVEPKYARHVASVPAETAFVTAAMNNLVPLLDELDTKDKEIDELNREILDLKMELILLGRITEDASESDTVSR